MIENSVKELLDSWHVCPFQDDAAGLFNSLRICTESYINARGTLTMAAIVNIVKDLTTFLNSHGNENLTHFTDLICDNILLHFKGMEASDLPSFNDYTYACEAYMYGHF